MLISPDEAAASSPAPAWMPAKTETCGEAFKDLPLILTDENFAGVVTDKHSHVFVRFHAPWCGHSQNMVPAYEDLAREFARNKDSIVIAELDVSKYDEIGQRHAKAHGTPTLKFFGKESKGTGEYCHGERDTASMAAYIQYKVEYEQ